VSPVAAATFALLVTAAVAAAISRGGAGMIAALVAAVAAIALVLVRRPAPRSVAAGDYVESAGRLYRIEYVRGDRVLLEDCRTGDFYDAGVAEVEGLRVVKRSRLRSVATS
jgi:hypothetical protein